MWYINTQVEKMLTFSTSAIHRLGLIGVRSPLPGGVGLYKVIQITRYGRQEIKRDCAVWLHWEVRGKLLRKLLVMCTFFLGEWHNCFFRLSKGWDIHLGHTETWNTARGAKKLLFLATCHQRQGSGSYTSLSWNSFSPHFPPSLCDA